MLKHGLKLMLLFLFTLGMTASWNPLRAEEGAIPAYNPAPPKPGTKLPPILGKDQLWGENGQYAFQTRAYELAAKIPSVLHQQPCYCYCDRMGHNSLHSCFESTHGAQCATCLKELYYSYAEFKKGKTASQIRKGIIAGDWKQVDLQTAATIR